MSGYDADLFDPKPDPDLICPICQCVFDDPVECKCRHVFCRICVGTWLSGHDTCPTCRKHVDGQDLRPVMLLVQNLLNRLAMKCPFNQNGCKEKFQLEKYKAHMETCLYEKIRCSYQKCDHMMLRKDFDEHYTSCSYREDMCKKHCGLFVLLKDQPSHDCVNALKEQVQEYEKQLADLKAKNRELQLQLDEARAREIQARDGTPSSNDYANSVASLSSYLNSEERYEGDSNISNNEWVDETYGNHDEEYYDYSEHSNNIESDEAVPYQYRSSPNYSVSRSPFSYGSDTRENLRAHSGSDMDENTYEAGHSQEISPGNSPSDSRHGSPPSDGGFGSPPSVSGFGSRPSVSGYGSHPSVSGYGSRPSVSGFGSRPSDSRHGSRPNDSRSSSHSHDRSFSDCDQERGSPDTYPFSPLSRSQNRELETLITDADSDHPRRRSRSSSRDHYESDMGDSRHSSSSRSSPESQVRSQSRSPSRASSQSKETYHSAKSSNSQHSNSNAPQPSSSSEQRCSDASMSEASTSGSMLHASCSSPSGREMNSTAASEVAGYTPERDSGAETVFNTSESYSSHNGRYRESGPRGDESNATQWKSHKRRRAPSPPQALKRRRRDHDSTGIRSDSKNNARDSHPNGNSAVSGYDHDHDHDDRESESDRDWTPPNADAENSGSSEFTIETVSDYEVRVPKSASQLLDEYESCESDDSWKPN